MKESGGERVKKVSGGTDTKRGHGERESLRERERKKEREREPLREREKDRK